MNVAHRQKASLCCHPVDGNINGSHHCRLPSGQHDYHPEVTSICAGCAVCSSRALAHRDAKIHPFHPWICSPNLSLTLHPSIPACTHSFIHSFLIFLYFVAPTANQVAAPGTSCFHHLPPKICFNLIVFFRNSSVWLVDFRSCCSFCKQCGRRRRWDKDTQRHWKPHTVSQRTYDVCS